MLLYHWLQEVADKKGGAKSLISRDNYISWRSLVDRVDRRAAEFTSIGVRPGDALGLLLGNVPDLVILTLALNKLNAIPVPLDPTTNTKELESIMETTPLRGLITRPRGGDAPLLPTTSSASRKGEGINGRKIIQENRKRLQGTLLNCSIYAVEQKPLPAEDDIITAILFTTSANGQPKPVERTKSNLASEAEHISQTLAYSDEDRALLTLPFYHSFCFDVGFAAALRAGVTLYLEDEVAPSRIIKLVKEQKITILPASPMLFEALSKLPAAKPIPHKPLRFISVGRGLVGSNADIFFTKYGTRPLACFHTTETGTVSIDVKGQHGETVGKPLAGVEVRISHSTTGKPVGTSRTGVLWVRSQAVSPLHFVAPIDNPPDGAIPVGNRDGEGWYRTGDLASLDRSGRLTLRGREDDLVRIDGRRVALGEVATCIESHPKVQAAQALVLEDSLAGPMIVARVILKEAEKADQENIIDHCTKNLSPYKVPRRIEFCSSL